MSRRLPLVCVVVVAVLWSAPPRAQEPGPVPPSLAASVSLIRAPEAWAAGFTGQGWYVAVLDSGVETAHSFLRTNQITPTTKVDVEVCTSYGDRDPNSLRAVTDGLTLCGPGYDGQITTVGPGAAPPCTTAGCEQGTHMAGIAAGGTGVAGSPSGVAPDAKIIGGQIYRMWVSDFQDKCGASPRPCRIAMPVDIGNALADVGLTVDEAVTNATAAIVIGYNSPGTLFTTRAACNAVDPDFTQAVAELRFAGIAVIAPAGDGGSLTGLTWPSCVTNVISVGATTKSDLLAQYSNRGTLLSLVAPGDNIISSVPGNTFAARSGTAMAAAHVAGAWAVLKQAKPTATVTQILTALQNSGVAIDDPFVTGARYKRIDVEAARIALTGAGPAAPAPPTNVAAAVNGFTATVTWGPGVGGGLPTHYLVAAGTTPGGTQLGLFNVGLTTLASGVLGPGTYYARVIAVNAAGQSAPSAEVTITVGGVTPPPGPPGTPSATINGTTVTLTWTAPASGGTPASYTVIAALAPGGPAIATLPVSGLTTTVTNVPPGVYYVRIVASNAGGASAASSDVTVSVGQAPPPTRPGPPRSFSAFVYTTTVVMDWSPPASGGAPTSYRLQAGSAPGLSDLADISVGSQPYFDATGVPIGVYFVRVRAQNAGGISDPSNEVVVVAGGPACSGRLNVIMMWNTGSPSGTPTKVDMDLHGFEPDGTHVWGGNAAGMVMRLAHDNTVGRGPEVLCLTTEAAPDGFYAIDAVAYEGNQWPTTVTIWINNGLSDGTKSYTRTFDGPDPHLSQRVAFVEFPFATITEVIGTRVLSRPAAEADSRDGSRQKH